jgi:osmotically-inducible protein OsmY
MSIRTDRPAIDDEEFAFFDVGTEFVQTAASRLLSERASLMQVNCRVDDCEAVLTGPVPSYYAKQLAQTIVRHVIGHRRLQNLLHVASESMA